MTKYRCNKCAKKVGWDCGPCILKTSYESFPPEYCPYDGTQIHWKQVRK